MLAVVPISRLTSKGEHFHCRPYNARFTADVCARRQEMSKERYVGPKRKVTVDTFECRNCEDGRRVIRVLNGEKIIPRNPDSMLAEQCMPTCSRKKCKRPAAADPYAPDDADKQHPLCAPHRRYQVQLYNAKQRETEVATTELQPEPVVDYVRPEIPLPPKSPLLAPAPLLPPAPKEPTPFSFEAALAAFRFVRFWGVDPLMGMLKAYHNPAPASALEPQETTTLGELKEALATVENLPEGMYEVLRATMVTYLNEE